MCAGWGWSKSIISKFIEEEHTKRNTLLYFIVDTMYKLYILRPERIEITEKAKQLVHKYYFNWTTKRRSMLP